jgi:SET domain-containing protein
MPHDGVYSALGVTENKGIGVFCIREIPKNMVVFAGDPSIIVWVHAKQIDSIEPELRNLYLKYGLRRKDHIGIVPNLNALTVGWYVNHNHIDPNLSYNYFGYYFYSNRDIRKGEELTANYDLYCENRKYDFF